MWMTERGRRLPVQEAEAELGQVTLGGDPAAVILGGERRQVPVYSPGGYAWRPAAGDRVLVLKAGGERESPCILGKTADSRGLAPGEVRFSGGSSRVTLGRKALDLEGKITVNGTRLEEYIEGIVIAVLGELLG